MTFNCPIILQVLPDLYNMNYELLDIVSRLFRITMPSFKFAVTVTCMKRWGLRASSLSAVTKADAGQKPWHNHLTPNVLYMMLAVVIHYYSPHPPVQKGVFAVLE